MNYGDMVTGTTQRQMPWYPFTFSGTSGEKVLVRVSQSTGTAYTPLMSLRRPAGTERCNAQGAGINEFAKECTLNATGTHTIWVHASSGTASGTYQIYVAR